MWQEFSKKAAIYAFVRTSQHQANKYQLHERQKESYINFNKTVSIHNDWGLLYPNYLNIQISQTADVSYSIGFWELSVKYINDAISLIFISIPFRSFFHFSTHVKSCWDFYSISRQKIWWQKKHRFRHALLPHPSFCHYRRPWRKFQVRPMTTTKCVVGNHVNCD